jgi:hypothetical protein
LVYPIIYCRYNNMSDKYLPTFQKVADSMKLTTKEEISHPLTQIPN